MASIDRQSLLTNEKLEAAFRDFDINGDGSISLPEIKRTLTGDADDNEISDEIWKKILNEVDEDGNGEIDQDEFKFMMRNLLLDDGDDEDQGPKKPADDSFTSDSDSASNSKNSDD